MKKGKRIQIALEEKSVGGVITTTAISATVAYSHGDNITVQGADGFIHQIDRNIVNDAGAYVVLA